MSKSAALIRNLLLFSVILLGFAGPVAGIDYPDPVTAADGKEIEIDYNYMSIPPGYIEHIEIYSATIGLNWSALPDRQLVHWFTTGPNKSALDISGPVYLTSKRVVGGGYEEIVPPQQLKDQPWFVGSYLPGAYLPTRCCFYHDCPDTDQWSHTWSYTTNDCVSECSLYTVEQYENINTWYFLTTDPGGGLENGVLRLLDGHGGATGTEVLFLEQLRLGWPEAGHATHFLLFFAYAELV